MTNNRIDSVKIIHDELCGEEYRVLSDFLRLVGIFVCNSTYQDNRLDDEKFDLIVYINSDKSSDENLSKIKSRLERIGKKLCVVPGRSFNNTAKADDNYRNEVLDIVFQFISDNDDYLMKDDMRDWHNLAVVFLKDDFVKARRFVHFRHASNYAKDAKHIFLDMVVSMSSIYADVQKSGRQSRYIDYAYVHLAYLINESCSYLKQNFYFDNQSLYGIMERFAIQYNDFENFYLLMAFLAELDPVLTLKAEYCYQMAATKLESFSYANYAYYRYGRYCEMALKDERKARDYYDKAFKVNPKEYRAIYKLGYYALRDKHYEDAASSFRRILWLMEGKFEANTLQENEYEYYYKSCKILENIDRITGNHQMAEEYARKANVLLNKTRAPSSNSTYEFLFKEEAEKLLGLTRKRLEGRDIGFSLLKVRSVLNG